MKFSKVDRFMIFPEYLQAFQVFNNDPVVKINNPQCLNDYLAIDLKDLLAFLYQWIVGIIDMAVI